MQTDQLIATLARDIGPVRPLPRPWTRTLVWTGVAALYLALLVLVASPRQDLAVRLQEPRFVVEQIAAMLTGLTAAAAALATTIPGVRRSVVLVPLGFLLAWIGAVGMGAWQDAVASGTGFGAAGADWRCVATVVLATAVPGALMVAMLRRGAPLTPYLTAALAGLAAAGLGNLGVCMFHPHSSNVTVLVWHCGTVLAISAVAAAAGARLLRWPATAAGLGV